MPVAVDRDAALKRAEKLLQQGKLEGAIAEYVRLIENHPHDWNSINALGDLYVRVGKPALAVDQFALVADHLLAEGFIPKAAAVYRKALKVKNDHEPTLSRLVDIAVRQKLLTDARAYLAQLAACRQARGDARGEAECLIRLGTLDDADAGAQMAAARAAVRIGDVAQGVALLKAAAGRHAVAGRREAALETLSEAAELDPGDLALRSRLAREYLDAGAAERARPFLTLESAADDPSLLLALARAEIVARHDQQARHVLLRLLTIAPDRAGDVVGLAQEVAGGGDVERAYACVDVATDAALLDGDAGRAVDVLTAFTREVRHLPALMRLVELCVDAGVDGPLFEARTRLTDAYLDAGMGTEARIIAEDLVDSEPLSDEHSHRLRRALELLGTDNAAQIVADRRTRASEPEPLLAPPAADDSDPVEETAAVAADADGDRDVELVVEGNEEPPATIDGDDDVVAAREVDLSTALTEIAAVRQQETEAEVALDRGMTHLHAGRADEAIVDLQAAARTPLCRFKAGAALGGLHIGRGELQVGIEWLERAAEAPAPSAEQGFDLLYELADVLELSGESARALAVLLELEAGAGAFRDVHERIDRLTRLQAAGGQV